MTLRGPREIIDFLNIPEVNPRDEDYYGPPPDEYVEAMEESNRSARLCHSIRGSIWAVMPGAVECCEIAFRAQLVELSNDWRDELIDIARGKSVHNQANAAERVIDWMQLRFRSHAEVRIAQALEKEKVLFFPNCRARLGLTTRFNREPDFLICHEGRWGILEVDGPYHKRAADDHDRDRLFRAHGILHIERFDAAECFENSDRVVKKFLYLLKTANP
jgi:very-short-patch-repair endonuclease